MMGLALKRCGAVRPPSADEISANANALDGVSSNPLGGMTCDMRQMSYCFRF